MNCGKLRKKHNRPAATSLRSPTAMSTIFLDDHFNGGLLAWTELALERPGLDLPLELSVDTTDQGLRSPAGRDAWLVKALRRNCFCSFLLPLLHTGRGLTWKTDSTRMWGDTPMVTGRTSAAPLFGLDPDHARRDLESYRELLRWVQAREAALGPDARVGLQWFRGGYRSRGLEWYGLTAAGLNDTEQDEWRLELAERQRAPWCAAWTARNLDGLARVRLGPHCWFSMKSLRPRVYP